MNNKTELKKFTKESVQSIKFKKGDRMIIDGPVELQIDEFKIDQSLDNVVSITLSMPSSNSVLKLGPGASMQKGPSFEQQKKRIYN